MTESKLFHNYLQEGLTMLLDFDFFNTKDFTTFITLHRQYLPFSHVNFKQIKVYFREQPTTETQIDHIVTIKL